MAPVGGAPLHELPEEDGPRGGARERRRIQIEPADAARRLPDAPHLGGTSDRKGSLIRREASAQYPQTREHLPQDSHAATQSKMTWHPLSHICEKRSGAHYVFKARTIMRACSLRVKDQAGASAPLRKASLSASVSLASIPRRPPTNGAPSLLSSLRP